MRAIPGTVYILTNPSMEGIIKIGVTTLDPGKRAADLSRATGVPTPFEIAYTIQHAFPFALEEAAHREFAAFRVSEKREFFRMPVPGAAETIESIAKGVTAQQTMKALEGRPLRLVRLPEDLGEEIRTARKGLGLTQEQLACACGVGPRVVIDIERGKSTAQIGIVLRLCDGLGLTLAAAG